MFFYYEHLIKNHSITYIIYKEIYMLYVINVYAFNIWFIYNIYIIYIFRTYWKIWTCSQSPGPSSPARDGNFWVEVKVKSLVNELSCLLIGWLLWFIQSEVSSALWQSSYLWLQLKIFHLRAAPSTLPACPRPSKRLPTWPTSCRDENFKWSNMSRKIGFSINGFFQK